MSLHSYSSRVPRVASRGRAWGFPRFGAGQGRRVWPGLDQFTYVLSTFTCSIMVCRPFREAAASLSLSLCLWWLAFFAFFGTCFLAFFLSLSLVSLWAITFGALGRSRLFGRTLILRVLAPSISLGCSFLASSFVSLSLYSDNLMAL